MDWFLLVIISAISASFARVLQKILLTGKDNQPIAFAFIFGMFVTFVMLIWAVIEGFKVPSLIPLAPNIIAMTLLYSLGNILLFKAFKSAEASEVSILFASSTIWAVISAMVLLDEELTSAKIVATLLVFFGVVTIYYSRSKWKLNISHLFAILSAVCFGIAFTNDAFIVGKFDNVSSYMFIAFLLPSLAVLLYDPKAIKKLKPFFQKDLLLKLLLTSFIYGISAITVFQAYKNGGEASVISPISQSSVIMTVVISYFLLKERDRLPQKIVGAILVLSGVWLLT